MNLTKLIDIYTEWRDYEDVPSEELVAAIDELEHKQSDEVDAFFWKVIDDFNEDKDIFWLSRAIDYLHNCRDKKFAQDNLERIISEYEKFGILGPGLGKAANYLGVIADYPNDALKSAIRSEVETEDKSEALAHRLFKASAYGAYIMTATDFETGLRAGRAIKDSGETPTIERAEEVIKKWRADHGKG